MKGIAILAAGAALLSLAGCNRAMPLSNAGANAAAGNVSSAAAKPADGAAANQASPQTADAGKLDAGGGAIPASSTMTNGIRLDRTFLLGHWTDDGNCDKATEFNADGRFVTPDGLSGSWTVDGEWVVLSGNRTMRLRIVPVDQNTINVVHEDGSVGHSTRC